jgi:signal transduction histidine kinase
MSVGFRWAHSLRGRVAASVVLATLMSLATLRMTWQGINAVHDSRVAAAAELRGIARIARELRSAVATHLVHNLRAESHQLRIDEQLRLVQSARAADRLRQDLLSDPRLTERERGMIHRLGAGLVRLDVRLWRRRAAHALDAQPGAETDTLVDAQMARLTLLIDSLSDGVAERAENELRASDRGFSRAVQRGLLGLAGAGLIGVLLVLLSTRTLMRNIQRLAQGIVRLANPSQDRAPDDTDTPDDEFAPLHAALRSAEHELRESMRQVRVERDRSSAIVQSALAAVFVVDRGGRVLLVNASAASTFRRPAEQMVGRLLGDLIAPDSLRITVGDDGALDCSRALLEERFRTRVRVHGAGAMQAIVAVTALPVDVMPTWAIFISDQTAQHTAQRALEEARAVAESANRAKSAFLARMSHELRTPLNSIIGFAKIVRRSKDTALGERDRLYLERVQSGGEHLLALVNDILDLARIESGKVELLLEPVDVGRIVRDVVPMFEAQLADRPVSLLVDLPAGDAMATADVVRLRQVLVNLIGNAVKFTPRGTIRVVLRADADSGRALALSVADTGIGIPVDRQARIFEAFEQADKDTAHRFGGTGLGLAIARQIVEQMGGRLSVESMPGVGSTFSVHFPLTRGRTPHRATPVTVGAA